MKANQYINGFSKMVMLVVACLLLLPAELLPHNDPREIDIGAPLSLDCPADIVVDSLDHHSIAGGTCFNASLFRHFFTVRHVPGCMH